MRAIRYSLVALALFVSAIAGATQDPPKAGFTCTTEGDTLETFKVTCEASTPIDRTSAQALAESWIRLTDRRKANEAEYDKVFDAWEAVVNKAIRDDTETLLNKDALDLLEKGISEDEIAEEKYRFGDEFKPMQITESSEEGGTTLILTSQEHVVPGAQGGGDTNLLRLTCIKGDDSKWRVNNVEMDRRRRSRVKAGDPPEWEAIIPHDLGRFYQSRLHAGRKINIAELKQDTDESAARSLVNWLLMKRQIKYNELFLKHSDACIELQEQLYTKEWIEWVKQKLDDESTGGAIPDFELVKAEIEAGSETHTVWFKLSYDGQTDLLRAIAVKVRKDGDVWKVAAAGVSETYGKAEGYEEIPNIYSLIRRAG